ncbi:alpha-galactosidase [Diaminobutyricibacter tongyongensis]|uniref:Alpha-galactosidase n=1 Tax=Leifsonia tongyongensis TaxID=1268043 RepID=A0A6L9XXU6_9MICO|nr:alpha-galactosidase [Diaminobutyricibacter tongyongensis]
MKGNDVVNQWVLATAGSEYVVSLSPDGSGLVLDHWGPPLHGGTEPWSEPDRFLQYAFPQDAAPLEYASAGHRQTAFGELIVDRGDGATGARWQCEDTADPATIETSGSRTTLTVAFRDETGTLRLTLLTEVDTAHDAVRRSASIENLSDGTIVLDRAFSAGWPLPVGRRPRIHYLAGAWSQEFGMHAIDLDLGTFSIGSRLGVTSLAFNPVVTVESAVPGREPEAFGVALEWSGNWRLQVEAPFAGDRVRVSCGVDDETNRITLFPGERFDSPVSSGVWSGDGPDGVARAWHAYQRDRLARTLDTSHRPVVYNSWMATEFDVRIDHQLELAAVAERLGVEVFVVDDGWFRGRTSDRAGLGDWTPDPVKFPQGLDPLAEAVIAKGMRFGLWVEPEAVNPDSDLFRAHPEWVYRAADRPLLTSRNQYVLDLGRADVVAWVEDTLRGILDSTPISYLKWDMNRPISDGGRPGDPHGREWSIQHARGYYRILAMLRREYPHVTIEACAAGGGRIDNAVLALSDVVWPSDETGPRDRLLIQHGFLSAYPQHIMSSWVTDAPGTRDRSATSFEYRFLVAMAGSLGIGADLLKWDETRVARAAELVGLYRSLRHLLHTAEVTRHGEPSDPTYAIEYSPAAQDADPVIVLVFDHDRDRVFDHDRVRIRPRTLEPERRYQLRGTGTTVTGAQAASTGVVVPFALAVDADILVFDPVG